MSVILTIAITYLIAKDKVDESYLAVITIGVIFDLIIVLAIFSN